MRYDLITREELKAMRERAGACWSINHHNGQGVSLVESNREVASFIDALCDEDADRLMKALDDRNCLLDNSVLQDMQLERYRYITDAMSKQSRGLRVFANGNDWNYPGMCPAQWLGRTEDGEEVYVRYRGGHLSIEVADELVFYRDLQRPHHGEMTQAEMLELTGIIKLDGAPDGR